MISLFNNALYKMTANPKKRSIGSLIIKLENIQGSKGVLNVSLHQADWNNVLRSEVFPFMCVINDTIVIDNLPYGEYAIRIFHDENCNGVADMNYFGYAKEAVGYSCDKATYYLAPTTDQCKTKFDEDHNEVRIRMKLI